MRVQAGLFRALADETRLRMVGLLLLRRELCVCDFVAVLGITQSKASRHLQALRHSGLVDDRRAGVWVHYRRADAPSPAVRAAVRCVRTVLSGVPLEELGVRLERALARKAAGGGVCLGRPGRGRSGGAA